MPGSPPQLRHLTPEWLTGVLRASGALVRGRVSSLELEPLGTFSTEVWRLRLTIDPAEPSAPSSLVLKRPVAGRRDRAGEGFDLEVRAYRELLARTPIDAPAFHFGNPGGGESAGGAPPGAAPDEDVGPLLLLEDVPRLPGFDWLGGATRDHARRGIDALAQLHAHWWERVDALDWVPDLGDPTLLQRFEAAFALGWPIAREAVGAIGVPGFAEIGEALVGRVAASLVPLASPATLLHGDAHGENLPLVASEDGSSRVVFLDWAGPRRGNPVFDVAFFVVMSHPVEQRRRVEQSLVARHADALRALGSGALREPWDEYRRGVLRRAARIVENAPGFARLDGRLAPALAMVLQRCAAAAVDLEVGELVA